MIIKSNPDRNSDSGLVKSYLRRRWLWILGFLAALYIVPLILLIVCENSLVYAGSRYPKGNWAPKNFQFDEITFESKDGTELVGWFLPRRANQDAPHPKETVLLFHGNAENVAESAGRMGIQLQECLNADVFVMDYRGFGKSKGVATYQGVLMDSEASLDWLCKHTGKQADQIILVGHSLGGGPACYLANKRGCKGVILDRTYASLPETAQKKYPIFPVQYLMQNRYPSKEWLSDFKGPVFISHGKRDTLIPWEQGQAIYDASTSNKKKFHLIEGWGHWDAFTEDYWQTIAEFYREHIVDGKPESASDEMPTQTLTEQR